MPHWLGNLRLERPCQLVFLEGFDALARDDFYDGENARAAIHPAGRGVGFGGGVERAQGEHDRVVLRELAERLFSPRIFVVQDAAHGGRAAAAGGVVGGLIGLGIPEIEAYINSIRTLQARFVQSNPNGSNVQGTLYVSRPGKMRFQYDPPSQLKIVADGRQVTMWDPANKDFGQWPIGWTAASFLVMQPFRLSGVDQPDGSRALDWQAGALASLPGGCQIGIKFRPDSKATPDALKAAAGKEFQSSDAAIRAVKPVVAEIVIGY